MDDAGTCAGIRPQLGVYLTGAIGPADRAAVVRHLGACADCRAELAGLAALPGLVFGDRLGGGLDRRPAQQAGQCRQPGQLGPAVSARAQVPYHRRAVGRPDRAG